MFYWFDFLFKGLVNEYVDLKEMVKFEKKIFGVFCVVFLVDFDDKIVVRFVKDIVVFEIVILVFGSFMVVVNFSVVVGLYLRVDFI